MCIPNFSTTFLLDNQSVFGSESSFASLKQCTSINSPAELNPLGSLHASSSTIKTNHRTYQRRRKLKVLSLNYNSIKSVNKQAEFLALLDLHQPDVVLGCESKIDSSISTYSVFPDRYEVFRKDRSCHGGGVFISINNSIISFCEPNLDVQDCEIITASIQFTRTKKLYMSNFYNPSSSDISSLNLLDDFLSKLYSRSQCPQLILGGDFNCGGVDWSTLDLHPEVLTYACDHALLSIVDKYGLSQQVKWLTRDDTTLDLAFSSRPETIQGMPRDFRHERSGSGVLRSGCLPIILT